MWLSNKNFRSNLNFHNFLIQTFDVVTMDQVIQVTFIKTLLNLNVDTFFQSNL